MTLYILDPNLVNAHGHHLEWDSSIAIAAVERDQRVIIFAHVDFNAPVDQRVTVIPYFSNTIYESQSKDAIIGRYDDFRFYNDKLFVELLSLPVETIRPTDAVLVPTLNENHLLGFVAWMKTFDSTLAPLFIVHLMFPSGLDISRNGVVGIADEQQALFYGLAFRQADAAHIKFFGGGRQLAREYSALSNRSIEPHALPLCPRRRGVEITRQRKVALLFAGDAKVNKGVTLLPELVARLCGAYPGWDFVVHVNAGQSYGDALKAYDQLIEDQNNYSNLQLHTGRLERDLYLALLEQVDAVVFTYDPVEYARKSSGVLWESISMGLPVLVPTGTWLSKEADDWKVGYIEYAPYSVEAIATRFHDFSQDIAALRAQSIEASKQYQRLNGPATILDQIAQLWLPRFMAASMTSIPDSYVIKMTELTGASWHELENSNGTLMRWTGREVDIEFKWPHSLHWELEVGVRKFIGTDQVQNAEACLEGNILPIHCEVHDNASAVLVVAGPSGKYKSPVVRLRLRLPYTYRPPHESRELGILVDKVVLRPRSSKPARGAPLASRAEVVSNVQWDRSGTQFLMRDYVSGFAIVEPNGDIEFKFNIQTEGGPEVVRALRLFVNGCAVRGVVIALEGNTWSWVGRCPSSVLSKGGFRADWDLALDHKAISTDIWIGGVSICGIPLVDKKRIGQTHSPLLSGSAVAGDIEASERTSVKEEATFGGGGATTTGSTEAGLTTAHEGAIVAAEGLRLDEYHLAENYRHLDISLMAPKIDGAFWPQVRFKFAVQNDNRSLEIRKIVGWPEMFVNWPEAEEDRFGPFLRLYESTESVTKVRGWEALQDRLLIKMLMVILPSAVELAASRSTKPDWDAALWHAEATKFSANFLDLMGVDGFQSNVASLHSAPVGSRS